MSREDGVVNLLIQDSNGQSKIIQVQKGGKLILSGAAKRPIPVTLSSMHSSNDVSNNATSSTMTNYFNGGNSAKSNSGKSKYLSTVDVVQNEQSIESSSSDNSQVFEIDKRELDLVEDMDRFERTNGNSLLSPGNSSVSSLSPPSPPLIVDDSQKFLPGTSHADQPSTSVMSRKRTESSCTNAGRNSSYVKKMKVDKAGKGLRHFSMKVCEKVRFKGTTTYNEVADELVEEFTNPRHRAFMGEQYDQKNIRRRVYDALNVLMAMNIISKDRKEIKWIGLPNNTLQECINLLNEKKQRKTQVQEKLHHLYDLILHQVSYKQLVRRNAENEQRGVNDITDPCRLKMPFILVSTSKKTFVDCNISHDKSEYLMLYNDKYEIHDDIEVLKRMNLVLGLDKGCCNGRDLELAKQMTPNTLKRYVEMFARGVTNPSTADMLHMLGEYPNSTSSSFSARSLSNMHQYVVNTAGANNPRPLPAALAEKLQPVFEKKSTVDRRGRKQSHCQSTTMEDYYLESTDDENFSE